MEIIKVITAMAGVLIYLIIRQMKPGSLEPHQLQSLEIPARLIAVREGTINRKKNTKRNANNSIMKKS